MATASVTPKTADTQPTQPTILPAPSPVVTPQSLSAVLDLTCQIAEHAVTEDRLATTDEQRQQADRLFEFSRQLARKLGYQLVRVSNKWVARLKDETAQSIVEYGTLAAAILLVTIVAIKIIGTSANAVFSQVGSAIQ